MTYVAKLYTLYCHSAGVIVLNLSLAMYRCIMSPDNFVCMFKPLYLTFVIIEAEYSSNFGKYVCIINIHMWFDLCTLYGGQNNFLFKLGQIILFCDALTFSRDCCN